MVRESYMIKRRKAVYMIDGSAIQCDLAWYGRGLACIDGWYLGAEVPSRWMRLKKPETAASQCQASRGPHVGIEHQNLRVRAMSSWFANADCMKVVRDELVDASPHSAYLDGVLLVRELTRVRILRVSFCMLACHHSYCHGSDSKPSDNAQMCVHEVVDYYLIMVRRKVVVSATAGTTPSRKA